MTFQCIATLNPARDLPFTCGKCTYCRIQKQKEWTGRNILEMAHSQNSAFVTLTTEPLKTPIFINNIGEIIENLSPKMLKKFHVDLRYRIGSYRHYSVGEYGDKTFRPHYHMGIFTNNSDYENWENLRHEILKAWPHGHVHVSELNIKRCEYAAKHFVKGLRRPDEPLLEGRHQEFSRMSLRPGIGHGCVESMVNAYHKPGPSKYIAEHGDIHPTFKFNGQTWPIGKYLKTKIREQLGIPVLLADRIKINPNSQFVGQTENSLALQAIAENKTWETHVNEYLASDQIYKHKNSKRQINRTSV